MSDWRTQEVQDRDEKLDALIDTLFPAVLEPRRTMLADALTDFVKAQIEVDKAEDRQREQEARDY